MHVNIFLFDETINPSKLIYCSGDFVPYKKCIILYHDTDTYYPIITSSYKIFKFDQSIVKYTLSDITRIATHDNTDFKLVVEILELLTPKELVVALNNETDV